MTGRPSKLLSPLNAIRLAVIPLLALLTLVVTGDSVHAASFNPLNTSQYCKEGTGDIDPQHLVPVPGGISCTGDISQGSHPDVVGTFNIGVGADGVPITGDDSGDYNFGGVVNLSPSTPTDAEIPDGAILGKLASIAVLGLLNNPCVNQIPVGFTFMEATTDITNTVEPLPFGQSNDLAIIAGDNPPITGTADVKPPPAVTKYPSYLNAIFDPNWLDFGDDKIAGNADDHYTSAGPAPIKPVFRTVGVTAIPSASNLWVVLNLVIFDKGTKLPSLPAFDPAYGYPSVVVLQTSSAAGSATSPAPSAVTDFCTPLITANVSYGVTHDNPDTGTNEGGVPVRTIPAAGTVIPGIAYSPSQRDADGDGFENSLDPCPFNADTVWSPRYKGAPPRPGDGDVFAGSPSGDGIPDTCDTTPTEPTTTGSQPTDHDGDGFPNSGDNCPLIANPDQFDKDLENGEEVGDGIGDACDTPGTDGGTDAAGRPIPARSVAGKGPGVPDGDPILCIKVSSVTAGQDPNVAYSGCQTSLPALAGPGGTIDTSSVGGSTGTSAGSSGSAGGGTAGGGVGGPSSGIGSLSPVGSSVPAWAAIAAGLGAAGVIGSLGTLASRLVKRRRDI